MHDALSFSERTTEWLSACRLTWDPTDEQLTVRSGGIDLALPQVLAQETHCDLGVR